MAKVVKMCDMKKSIAVKVFKMLNQEKVHVRENNFCELIIVTDIEPKNLIYPEGWYYAKGRFRNKHNSTTGMYDEIRMIKSNGESWKDIALYSTQE